MKNKMAICEWCFPGLGRSALKLASDIGFEGIQLGDLGGASKGPEEQLRSVPSGSGEHEEVF